MGLPAEFSDFIQERGISLRPLGFERALTRSDALLALEILLSASKPVLGGDVYLRCGQRIELAYSNWHSDRQATEPPAAFARRSYEESKAYIQRFPHDEDAEALFVIVPSSS